MKKSLYNTFIVISDRYSLLYNSLTNTFLILTSELKQYWESFSEFNPIPNKCFMVELKKGGFIIESNVNEQEIFISKLKKNIDDNKYFHLTINPTLNCNLKCWYCYETHSNNKMDSSVSEGTKCLIKRILENKELEHLHLAFFGGEPMMFFNTIVKDLIQFTYATCMKNRKTLSLSFTTNGSLISADILKELKQYEIPMISFQITLDGDKSFHDKVRHLKNGKGTYETIIRNIRMILQCGFNVVMRINFTYENIDSSVGILKDLDSPLFTDSKKFQVNFQQVWQEHNTTEQFAEKIDKCISQFRESGINVLYHHMDRMNNPCYADKENELIINYNGEIYKCTAKDFDNTPSYGRLKENGEIMWNEEMIKIRRESLLPPQHCLLCRIAPICGGGCSQHLMNGRGKQYCVLNNDEKLKDKFILDRFENQFLG